MIYKKWYLVVCCCVFQITFGYSQHKGLLLIHQRKINRKVVLNQREYLTIHYGNQQFASGFLDSKSTDFVNLLPKGDKKTPLFDLTKENHLITYQIPISQIEYIKTKKTSGKKVGTILGIGFVAYGTFFLALGLSVNKSRPDLANAWIGKGIIPFGIGIPLILIKKQRKYAINKDAWVIN